MFMVSVIWSLLVSSLAGHLNTIESQGTRFYDTVTGKRFFIIGVAYQPRETGMHDVLANPSDCHRDALILKELGVNAIRVYETYPENNHDECMKIFDNSGIYAAFDLPIPAHSINRDSPNYQLHIYEHYKKKIDAFAKYSNTLMFFAGNEITNKLENTQASSYVKAALRDAKAYIKSKHRSIPVGYADNDDPKIRSNIQSFFNCGNDEDRTDFYGINIYSWCGKSSFTNSGYNLRANELKDYDKPVILSEYGCEQLPRYFGDIVSLYNSDMNQVFSGGFIYEYSQEINKHGLVVIKNGLIHKLDAFDAVKNHIKNIQLPNENKSTPIPHSSKKRDCPIVNENWKSSSILPPNPSQLTCECIMEHLDCQINESFHNTDHTKMGNLLDYICGKGHCTDISSDQEKGVYGAYSFCPINVQSSIALTSAVKSNLSECELDGLAKPLITKTISDKCKNFIPKLSSPSQTIIKPINLESVLEQPKPEGQNPPSNPNSHTNSLTFIPLTLILSFIFILQN